MRSGASLRAIDDAVGLASGVVVRVAVMVAVVVGVGVGVGVACVAQGCGGKIAPEPDAGFGGTCSGHMTGRGASACDSIDSVTCDGHTYSVSCACAASPAQCLCVKDGLTSAAVPASGCQCAPTREQLATIYVACGFPY